LIKKKRAEIVILFILIVYSIYCSLIVGKSWDAEYHYNQGKVVFQYLLSFGRIKKEYFYHEYYSPIYWFFQFFFSQLFPSKYKVEVIHAFNLLISILTIFGYSKLISEFFNKFLSKIFFLVLFFYPIFFGHMSFNPKDIVVAGCHVWFFYLVIRYLKNQSKVKKTEKYIYFSGVLLAIGTGVQLLFFGTLIPILLFIFCEIFFFKKIIKKTFSYKLFLINFLKVFLIFYIILIFFWPATHPNVILFPLNFIIKSLSLERGWWLNMVNGEVLLSKEVTIFYFYINFFFKSPEFILFNYFLFLFLITYFSNFFRGEFSNFIYKFFFLSLFLFMPILITKLSSFGIYDGIRLFLWCIPYFLIIPSMSIYFLVKNFKKSIFIFFCYINFLLFIIYFFIFISITPYHYTYLNFFKNFGSINTEKFEGDYWYVSIKELLKNSDFSKEQRYDLAICFSNSKYLKEYLNIYQKQNAKKINIVKLKDAKYVVMTNRVVHFEGNNRKALKNDTCFNKFVGSTFSSVSRLGREISTIRYLETPEKY
jgi:hypothetical protein